MVGMFAMIALVLASVGLYGVTAHSVIERTNEIGIRMALGAHSSEVAWMFLKRTLAHLAVGVPLGLAGALATGQLLRRFLVNTPSRDPVTLVAVALLLVVVALLACLLPARRPRRAASRLGARQASIGCSCCDASERPPAGTIKVGPPFQGRQCGLKGRT